MSSMINPIGLDFRHKGTEEALLIEGYKKPTWVTGQLKVGAARLFESDTSRQREGGYKKSSGSWDVRTVCKMRVWVWNNIIGPDFRHKDTEEALWIESYKIPAWIDGQLEGGAAQVFQSDTSKRREGIHKKSFCTRDVRTLCNTGQLKKALHILNQGGILADSITYISLLQECTKMKSLAEGKQVHAHIILSGFTPNLSLLNILVNMYVKCGSVFYARQVFDIIPERDVVTWTIMMAGYAKDGYGREAFKMYQQMRQERVMPNNVTFICVLKACASLGALEKGKEVHADIIRAGIAPDVALETSLANMYAKCGSLRDARKVFDNMAERNVVSWNAMIAGYAQHGYGREAFEIYNMMLQEGVTLNSATFICILKACASLEKGKEVHADIGKAGIGPDTILETALAAMYLKCGSVRDAREVFDKMCQRNVVSWNAMITGYAQNGCGGEAIEIYEQMKREGVMPDKVSFICVLNVCASLAALENGKEVHADIVKAATAQDIILETALVNMYAKCGSMVNAREVFNNMCQQDVVSWSALVAGYAQQGCGREALDIYEQMVQEGMMPNKVTFISVVNACASLGDLEKGKVVHADIVKAGIAHDIILETALVDMYAKCGNMMDAGQVFNNMTERNVVSWNAMIGGYAEHGCGREAFGFYEQMLREGVMPDKVTFLCVLNASASLGVVEKGKEVHADIMKAGITQDIILETALAVMYAKCGSVKDARQVFNNMAERNVVSWNAMIAGYTRHGSSSEAFEIYEQMVREGVTPNKVTFICVLNACASMGALEKGEEVHADIIKAGIVPDIVIENTLINMYAKCGSVKHARQVFDGMVQRNVVSWTAMIAGYGENGCGRVSVQLFEQMQQEGLTPNGITFTCLLSACSHVGLVDEGCHYFDSMTRDLGLSPTVEHFGCIVDLLGRAQQFVEAEDFINKMPIQPDASVLGALLGACRTHGNVEVAERVAKCLFKRDPQDAATYVLLSDVYAAAG